MEKAGLTQEDLEPVGANQLRNFSGNIADCLGIIHVTLVNKYNEMDEKIFICPKVEKLLLSFNACYYLGYLPDNFPGVCAEDLHEVRHVRLHQAQPLDTPRAKTAQLTHNKPQIHVGQHVRFQDTLSKCWRETGVILNVSNEACIIRSDKGYTYQRNVESVRPYNPGQKIYSPPLPESTRGGRRRSVGPLQVEQPWRKEQRPAWKMSPSIQSFILMNSVGRCGDLS